MDAPARLRRPRRRWLLWVVLGILVLVFILSAISGLYVDVLWFREVGLSSVFWTRVWSSVTLAAIFGAIFFVLMYTNLLIARRIRPRYQVFSPAEEYVERYRAAFEPYARWVIPAIALVFALFAASRTAGHWEQFQQWRVAGAAPFGFTDPLFNRDVSFYVLALPFQQYVQGWLFASLVVITLVTAAAHYLWGGIRLRAATERVTPQVKAHLSVLLGLIVLVKAWGYRLGQFQLLVSPRGTVTGASYTDIHAQLPALRVLVIIAIVCAALFLVNIRFRGWALPALGIGLLALTSIVAGAAYPAAIQRFRVAPQELQREQPFIERNIQFTRRAFGLDKIRTESFPAEPDLTPDDIQTNTETVQNIRLWNPDVLRQSYLQLQRIRPYYEFLDVDVDRYVIEGERRATMIAPREVSQNGISEGGKTWQNQHLFYTHGYGVAASRVDQVTTQGSPALSIGDIPVTGPLAPELEQPRIYFGEGSDVPFVVVNTETQELDYPQGEQQFARTRYSGTGGVAVGGFLRRAALAWHYRDVNLLISGLIKPESRVLINRDLATRVDKVAPFLLYDHDPYSAIVNGRLTWIWDAYTTTDMFPYSQRVDLGTATGDKLSGTVNYIRNSVKVTVDAYDGTMTFYVVDEDDPILGAWQKVFPDLFTPGSEAPLELKEHFRYPEDLFRIQAHQYANYHVTRASQFYAKEDFWQVPRVAKDPTQDPTELEPYYILAPLPGEADSSFLLFTPFTPANRPNMISWLAAKSDPRDYGELVAFRFPLERNVAGPGQVAAFISQDPEVSQASTLLGQLGSKVVYGDLLAIPIGRSFLYVQPLYLQSQGGGTTLEQQGIPELKRVVVVHGENVSLGTSLPDALNLAFGNVAPREEAPEAPTGTVSDLLAEAQKHFQAAQEALKRGDLATYQREIEAAQRAVDRAARLAGGPQRS